MSWDNNLLPSAPPPPYTEYPQVPQPQYGSQEKGGQPVPGYAPQQPVPGYPPHQPVPGYPPHQPVPGYPPQQPVPGYPPLQPGYPSNQTVYSTSDPSHPQTVSVQPQGNDSVVVVGGCPYCRVGMLEDSFTACGVCLAIFCFPIGLLCCLAMKEKKCSNCHSSFG